MPSKFEKESRPPLFEFDGFDRKSLYQMIPVQDRREMAVVTGPSGCLLRVNNPTIVTMANFRPPVPFPKPGLTTDSVVLPKNTRVAFSLLGKIAGQTEAVVEEGGTIQDALLISVKDRIKKNYALCSLADIVHKSSRLKTDAKRVMQLVEKLYLQMANLKLELNGDVVDVVVPKNLGNPIFLTPDVLSDIVKATPQSVVSGSQVTIYCCWDVDDIRPGDAAGVTRGQFSLIDDAQTGNDATMTFGHEVGHALGLNHNGDRDHLMFATVAVRASRLSQFEIDSVNPSGTAP